MSDNIRIEILPDGTIRIETDGISAANHVSADEFLNFLEELTAGGRKRRKRERTPLVHRHGGITHTHNH